MASHKANEPLLLSAHKVWDHAPHNAFTDLIRFQERWLIVFRESDNHQEGANGAIRLIASKEGIAWSSLALLTMPETDLRDPKLTITPDGKLLLLVAALHISNDFTKRQVSSYIALSADGTSWGPFHRILPPGEWLWRVVWHKGKLFGTAYSFNPDNRSQEWHIALYAGDDYRLEKIANWQIPGFPSETALQFTAEGSMIALARREGYNADNKSWIGMSAPPYTAWHWHSSAIYFASPQFLIIPKLGSWAAGRILAATPYGAITKTALAKMDGINLKPILILPSLGDTGYPGMVYHQDSLWMSYYSSHEGRTAIYFAKIFLPTT